MPGDTDQSEAEPLMRRMVEILLLFAHKTHHEHPHLRSAVNNYVGLLMAMKLSPSEVFEKPGSLGPEPLAILSEEIGGSER
jgi:hypothetical protein